MKMDELFDAQERFQLWQLMNSSFATILAKQAKTGKSLQTPKLIKPPKPTQTKPLAPARKSPQPFTKPERSKRQLAAIKTKPS